MNSWLVNIYNLYYAIIFRFIFFTSPHFKSKKRKRSGRAGLAGCCGVDGRREKPLRYFRGSFIPFIYYFPTMKYSMSLFNFDITFVPSISDGGEQRDEGSNIVINCDESCCWR